MILKKPSVGKIVHYTEKYPDHSPGPQAAVISKVQNRDTGLCQLFIFDEAGVYFNSVPHALHPMPGYWNWPPPDDLEICDPDVTGENCGV